MPPDSKPPPSGRAADGAAASGPAGSTDRSSRERRWRRTVGVGLLGSVLLHLLVVLFSGVVRIAPRSDRQPPTPRPEPEGLLVIELEEVPAPEEPEERVEAEPREPPAEREEPEERAPAVEAPGEPVEAPAEPLPAEGELDEDLTNAERLQPRVGDDRLWVEFDRPVVAERLERYARADSALRAILGAWLDSLWLTEEQRRRARDWTLGEGDNRWGISEEGLHLGDITIPLPLGELFQQSGPKAREARQALRELQEIRAQEARREAEEAARQRREEMRRRSQEEAERRGSDTTSSGG